MLVRLKALAKSLTGEQLAGELIDVLATQLQVPRAHVISAMRDGASVNGCALRALKALSPKMFEVMCFSHTIDLVGYRFEVPTLDQFIQWWIQLFSRSAAAKIRWKERTGVAIKSYSVTRWWSKWEVMNQDLTHFGHRAISRGKPRHRPSPGGSPACSSQRLEQEEAANHGTRCSY